VKTWSAAKKHTNEEQGGSRDPGVRRPGAGRGQLPVRSKIFRAAMPPFESRVHTLFIFTYIYTCIHTHIYIQTYLFYRNLC